MIILQDNGLVRYQCDGNERVASDYEDRTEENSDLQTKPKKNWILLGGVQRAYVKKIRGRLQPLTITIPLHSAGGTLTGIGPRIPAGRRPSFAVLCRATASPYP
jgi:hypothetical protein